MPQVAEVLELQPTSFSFTVDPSDSSQDQTVVPTLTLPVFVLALIGLGFTLQHGWRLLMQVPANGWAWLWLIPTLLLSGLCLMLGAALLNSRRKPIEPEAPRAFHLTDLELQLEPITSKLIVGKLLANRGSPKNLLQQGPALLPLELNMDQAETWITAEAKASVRDNRLEYDFQIAAPRLLRHAHPDAQWFLEFSANDQIFYRVFVTVPEPVMTYPMLYQPDRETQLNALLEGNGYELIAKAYNGRNFMYKHAREPYFDEFLESERSAVFTVSIHDLIDHAMSNSRWLEKNIYQSRIGGDGSFYMRLEAGLYKYMFTERGHDFELFVSPNVRDVLEAYLTSDPRAVKLEGTDELKALRGHLWKDPYGVVGG